MGAQPNCWQGRAMMYLFEGLFIFYLGWLAWRILKANLARNILAVVAIIVAVLSSTLLFLLLAAILPLLFDNLVLVLGLNAVLRSLAIIIFPTISNSLFLFHEKRYLIGSSNSRKVFGCFFSS